MTDREMSPQFQPLECTLPTQEQPLRVAEFDALFSSALRRVERREHSVLLTFDTGAEVEATVRDLLAREIQCCAFFTFSVRIGNGGTVVEVSVPETHLDILDGLVSRAAYQAGLATPTLDRLVGLSGRDPHWPGPAGG